MLDSFLVYIIPFMFSFFDLIIFMTFFREIPDGLEEAAKIDGANDWSIFLRVVAGIHAGYRDDCLVSWGVPVE